MGVLQKIDVSGSVSVGPVLPSSSPFPSSSGDMDISTTQVRPENRQSAFSVNSPSPAFKDLLQGMSISAVRLVAMRVFGGSLVVRWTTAAGVDQLTTVSDLLVISNPNAGSEITALAAQGVANVELIVAGDSP